MRRPNACACSGMRSESDVTDARAGLVGCMSGGANELGPGVDGGLRWSWRSSMVVMVVWDQALCCKSEEADDG